MRKHMIAYMKFRKQAELPPRVEEPEQAELPPRFGEPKQSELPPRVEEPKQAELPPRFGEPETKTDKVVKEQELCPKK